jgi:hypothetical protein
MKTSYVGRTRPTYVVLGIFHHTHSNLQERVVFVTKPEHLFRELWWAVFRLRGTWRFIFSLKHVTAFKLFTVRISPQEGQPLNSFPALTPCCSVTGRLAHMSESSWTPTALRICS